MGTTTQASLRYPELSDSPNAKTAVQNLANDVDTIVIPRFVSTTERDTKITSPVNGQMCYVSGTNSFYDRAGGAWLVMPRTVTLTDQMSADSASITSTTLLTVMTVTLPVAGTYYFDCFLIMTSTVAVGKPGFALGGTSTPTSWRWAAVTTHFNSATASQSNVAVSGTTYPTSTDGASVTGGTDWTTTSGFSGTTIKGLVTISASGTLTFRVNRVTGTSTVSVKTGSIARVDLVS